MNGTGFSECAVFGRAVVVEHVVAVAVIGGDDARAAGLVDRLDDPAEALVDGLDRLDRRPR